MENTTLEQTDDYTVMLDLGAALGQNHAFGLVAGRCSAAQAAMLQRLRQEKKYLLCSANWREFCTDFLRISGSEANRLIGLWEEFGPEYFEIAQLMRISPETYRVIAPAVKNGALHHNGEAIEFGAENNRRLAVAVSELRNSTKPAKRIKRERPMHERIADLDRRCSWIIAEFEEISRKESAGENWLQFTSTLTRARTELARIEAENGL
jgi:hypothetical protein